MIMWYILYKDCTLNNDLNDFIDGFNWKEANIGPDNGLAPFRRQAIIWSNVDSVLLRNMTSLSLNRLILQIWKKKLLYYSIKII